MAEPSSFMTRMIKQGVDPKPLANFFANIGLPLPQKGEYFITSDGGALVAVNDAAVVLRFSSRHAAFPCHDVRHADVLQPIARLEMENLVIELLPGVALGQDHNDLHRLIARLEVDGLHFSDKMTKVENMGYLPDGRAVIIDRNAITPTERYVPADAAALPFAHTRQILAHAFERACPMPFAEAPQGNPKIFWDACAWMKEAGQLVAGWMQPIFADIIYYHNHGQTSEVQAKSVLYAQSVDRHRPAMDACAEIRERA